MADRMAELRAMTVVELQKDLAGWRPGTENYLLTQDEIRRRQTFWPEVRSWLAFGISVLALIVAAFKK
jgi:hypothetical protein